MKQCKALSIKEEKIALVTTVDYVSVEIEGRLIKALLDNDIPFDENKINYTHA
jgi:hypothetical protein